MEFATVKYTKMAMATYLHSNEFSDSPPEINADTLKHLIFFLYL